MNADLQAFVDSRCIRSPEAKMPLFLFLKIFRTARPNQRQRVPRGMVIAALASAGYVIATGDDRRTQILGLCVRGSWADAGGRVTLVESTDA